MRAGSEARLPLAAVPPKGGGAAVTEGPPEDAEGPRKWGEGV